MDSDNLKSQLALWSELEPDRCRVIADGQYDLMMLDNHWQRVTPSTRALDAAVIQLAVQSAVIDKQWDYACEFNHDGGYVVVAAWLDDDTYDEDDDEDYEVPGIEHSCLLEPQGANLAEATLEAYLEVLQGGEDEDWDAEGELDEEDDLE
jgi:hypothetical protein